MLLCDCVLHVCFMSYDPSAMPPMLLLWILVRPPCLYFVLRLVWKSVFFWVLWHLCGYKTMQMCPSACFQHSDLSLLSPFCFLPCLQRGIFVTLCAGFELVCLVGRATWKFCERIIISGCCSSFEFIKTACEQPNPPILTLPPPLSVDVAVLPTPSRGRDTNLSHFRSISSQCITTATQAVRVQ